MIAMLTYFQALIQKDAYQLSKIKKPPQKDGFFILEKA